MQEKLIVFIHARHEVHPDAVILDGQSQLLKNIEACDPQALSALAQDRDIIVVVPAEDVTLMSAKMPKMSRSKLLQALPFALEDQLISDVDTLHFVAGDNQTEITPVAVVAKEKMQEWLTLLQSWNLRPDVIIPAVFAIPYLEHTWQIVIHDSVIVRTSEYYGFSCEISTMQELVQVAFQTATIKPETVVVQHANVEHYADSFPEMNVQIKSVARNELNLMMAKCAICSPQINLLNGMFKAKKTKFPQKRKLVHAMWAFTILWLVSLGVYPLISSVILNQRVASLHEEIQKIYQQNFPHATSMVAPRARMEEKLRKLNSHGKEQKLFLLLNDVGECLKSQAGIKLKKLDFQNTQLILDLTASSSDSFAGFTDALSKQGLKVKQQSANLVGENINAIIILE